MSNSNQAPTDSTTDTTSAEVTQAAPQSPRLAEVVPTFDACTSAAQALFDAVNEGAAAPQDLSVLRLAATQAAGNLHSALVALDVGAIQL